jgi:hypothetical protein
MSDSEAVVIPLIAAARQDEASHKSDKVEKDYNKLKNS